MAYVGMKYQPREYTRVKVNAKALSMKKRWQYKIKAYQGENAVHVIEVPSFLCRVAMTLMWPVAIIINGLANLDYVKEVLFPELFGKHLSRETYHFSVESEEFFSNAFPGIWY